MDINNPKLINKYILFIYIFLLAFFIFSCRENYSDVREVIYWQPWTGFEGEAIARVVDSFNKKEIEKSITNRFYRPIRVKIVTISKINRKLLVAIAGGDPPDVAGLQNNQIPPFADKGALVELTPFMKKHGLSSKHYLPAFFNLCFYQGKIWSLPTTPATVALHWNKRLFREAGLDPRKGPSTIEELDYFSEKLTIWEIEKPDGKIIRKRGTLNDLPPGKKRLLQIGFLHSEPGWFHWAWGYYFGGKLWDGKNKITSTHPGNIAALKWIESYSKKYGVVNLQKFRSGFGNFSSPQNPFLNGKVGMVLQGVWMYNFIDRYAPGMRWDAAPFPHPANRPDLKNSVITQSGMLAIPKDCRNPEEAFEFIRYVQSQEGMEMLCKGHVKFSPLQKVSAEFINTHPHPRLNLFRSLAESKNAFRMPDIGVWNEYMREFNFVIDSVQNLAVKPEIALLQMEKKIQQSFDFELKIRKMRSHD